MNHLPDELQRLIIEFSHVTPLRKVMNSCITAGRNKYGWDYECQFRSMHTTRILFSMLQQGYFPFHLPDVTISRHNRSLLEIPYVASILHNIGVYRRAGKAIPEHLVRMRRSHRKLSRYWHNYPWICCMCFVSRYCWGSNSVEWISRWVIVFRTCSWCGMCRSACCASPTTKWFWVTWCSNVCCGW